MDLIRWYFNSVNRDISVHCYHVGEAVCVCLHNHAFPPSPIPFSKRPYLRTVTHRLWLELSSQAISHVLIPSLCIFISLSLWIKFIIRGDLCQLKLLNAGCTKLGLKCLGRYFLTHSKAHSVHLGSFSWADLSWVLMNSLTFSSSWLNTQFSWTAGYST